MRVSENVRPGLLGDIAAAHGRYYAENWGFGVGFEAKVARDCGDYLSRAIKDDLTLSAWDGSRFLGSLVLDLHDPQAPGMAHLRWFIVPVAGRGLGRQLMTRAMQHLDQAKLPCFLTTFRGLDAARKLYEDFGFTLTDQVDGDTWGTPVTEQRFERPVT